MTIHEALRDRCKKGFPLIKELCSTAFRLEGWYGLRAFSCFLLCFLLPGLASAQEGGLRIGRAAVRITPPAGIPKGSSYGLQISQGVHDDLYAKALVLEVNGVRAALVACDLISLQPFVVEPVRESIKRVTGLDSRQVIISATHNHAGPQMHPLFLAQVGGEAQQLGDRYRGELPAKIAEAVRLAIEDLQPARAWAGTGHEDSISFNRRFLMKDGRGRMNPGAGNPEIVRVLGGIDPQVPVVYFDTPGGDALATHVNFAMHVAVTGGQEISADFPATISSLLSQIKGEQMLTLFTMGTAGDINHLDVTNRNRLSGRPMSKHLGTILAGEVLKTYSNLQPVSPEPLRSRTARVELPAREMQPGDPEKAREVFSKYGKDRSVPFQDVVWAWRVLDITQLKGRPLQADVQVISLGEQVAWVGLPGEIFVDLGQAIKKASPFRHTIISGMSASGTISYVPTRKAFYEGSYEVRSARFAPGGGEKLAQAAIDLLFELFPGDQVPDP